MKRFLAPLIAFSTALSTPGAFAMTCQAMFKEKGINGYEEIKARTKYEIYYSTEPNKQSPNYSDFSNWKLCQNESVKKYETWGIKIYCNNRLLIDGATPYAIFRGNWIDKNGGTWESNSGWQQRDWWNPPKSCRRGSYQGMASYYYTDTIQYGYRTYIKKLRETWAFTVKETRYFEAIPRPEF